MRTWTTIVGCALGSLVAVLPAVRASDAGHFRRVTLTEIRQLVIDEIDSRGSQQRSLPLEDDIELPLAVPIRATTVLRVSSVCWDADAGRARIRIECVRAGDCLPFLAYVRTGSNAYAPSCRPQSLARSPQLSTPILLRAGERATALLRAAGLRMTLQVTCLEQGSAGDVIRVRGQEGRVFRARIVSQSLVEATME